MRAIISIEKQTKRMKCTQRGLLFPNLNRSETKPDVGVDLVLMRPGSWTRIGLRAAQVCSVVSSHEGRQTERMECSYTTKLSLSSLSQVRLKSVSGPAQVLLFSGSSVAHVWLKSVSDPTQVWLRSGSVPDSVAMRR